MSFDKHYKNRKDRRKQYYNRAKQVSRQCRNNGSCPYCYGNRMYSSNKKIQAVKDQINEILLDSYSFIYSH